VGRVPPFDFAQGKRTRQVPDTRRVPELTVASE
jgi:hypothetical protein